MRLIDWLSRKTSYTFAVALVSVLGGQVASVYGFFFFLNRGYDVGLLTAKADPDLFFLACVFLFSVLLASTVHCVRFGLLRGLGIRIEDKKLRIINDSIHGLEPREGLDLDKQTRLLRALSDLPVRNSLTAAVLGAAVAFSLVGIVIADASIPLERVFTGIQAGLTALVIYVYLTYILSEFLSGPIRARVKRNIYEAGGKPEDRHTFSLQGKFASFIVFFLLTLVALNRGDIASEVPASHGWVHALFAFSSLAICAILVVFYFASILRSIQEVRDTAERLASGEPGYLFSGSLDREFVSLNRSLLGAAEEVERYRHRLEELVREKTQALENTLAELEKRERRFRALVEGGADIITILGADGTFLYASPSSEWILGYPADDLVGTKVFEFVHPDDIARVQKRYEDLPLSGCGAAPFEVRFRHKDGSWRVLEGVAKNLLQDPAIQGFVVVSQDITDRKQAEQSLRESEEKFRAISASAQDAIVMIDSDGNVCFWNTAAELIFGYKAEEVQGKNCHDLLAPERLLEAHRQAFARFRETGQGGAIGKTVELAAMGKGGREFPVELSLSAVYLRGAWHAVGLARDISERKRFEKALEEAKEAAVEASRAKGQFLANMSHEIRTPLNGIIGMTGLLLETDLTPEQREYAETINISAETLLALINDILDFSKIEAGRMELEQLDFDLRSTVEETLDMVAFKAQQKGLEVHYFVQPTVPTALRGDQGRLRQILLNLLSNAVKFTQEGEVFVHVSREEETDNRVTLRFSVTDTGIGIPKDRMDRLFQSFSQVDASMTRKYGGTGLGLAISARLAELMGGRVGVESRLGKGSTFWFTAVFEKQPYVGLQEEDIPQTIRGLRVLVVDDNGTNRLVLREQLRSWGCLVEESENGARALQKLEEAHKNGCPFPLALLDMQMPEMDGETLCRAIKAHPALAATKLVLLTSIGKTRSSAELAEMGFAAHLTKPVKRSQLYNCLLSVMAGCAAQKDADKHPAQDQAAPVTPASRRKARILVAEDNVINQKVALGMLRKLGFAADAVGNGREAIEALERIRYDLVFMDVQMPEMNGFEATAVIRDPNSRVLDHTVPVIAMTAHAMQGDREVCLQAGMTDYVPKPVNPRSLGRVLEQYLPAQPACAPEARAEQEPVSAPAPVQIAQIQEIADGDKAFERALIELFVSDNQERLKTLETLMANQDVEAIRREAHTIKGASASAGANGMREIAARLEEVDPRKELAQALRLLDELKAEFEEVQRFLFTYLETAAPWPSSRASEQPAVAVN
jgi:two-component system sensor histidine kinase/response regulator